MSKIESMTDAAREMAKLIKKSEEAQQKFMAAGAMNSVAECHIQTQSYKCCLAKIVKGMRAANESAEAFLRRKFPCSCEPMGEGDSSCCPDCCNNCEMIGVALEDYERAEKLLAEILKEGK